MTVAKDRVNSSLNQSNTTSAGSTLHREDELILTSFMTKNPSGDGVAIDGNKNGRTKSLIGFDPLLACDENGFNKQGDTTNKGVWTCETGTKSPHPLLDSIPTSTPVSTGFLPKKQAARRHRNTKSLGTVEIDSIMMPTSNTAQPRDRGCSVDEAWSFNTDKPALPTNNGSSTHRRRASFLRQQQQNTNGAGGGVPKSPSLLSRPTSVSRRSLSTTALPMLRRNASKSRSPNLSPNRTTAVMSLSPPRTPDNIQMPLLAKTLPTSFLKDNTMVMRSSEQEPAPFQVDIPSHSATVLVSKLCAFLDFYRTIDINFEIGQLVGVTRKAMNEFVTLNKPLKEFNASHKPIIRALLECGDDSITIEGYHADESEGVIFNSQVLHQLIVIYRGNDAEQSKPVKTTHRNYHGNNAAAVELHPDQPALTVYSAFRDAYTKTESHVCAALDQLTDADPFTEVVFGGHSFGGALALLGGLRYATMRPMLRVSCSVLGCPRVGSTEFRQMANSIPNLKIFRVEVLGDSAVQLPIDTSSSAAATTDNKWEHVGSSIVIGANGKKSASSGGIKAYRFDKNKPENLHNNNKPHQMFGRNKNAIDRTSGGYVKALEGGSNAEWVKDFCGEDVGAGVIGRNNEKRLLV